MTESDPMASLDYWVLRLALAGGGVEDIAPVQEAMRRLVPSAVSFRSMHEPDRPWEIVTLTLPPYTSSHAVAAIVEDLRAAPEVEDVRAERLQASLSQDGLRMPDAQEAAYEKLFAELALTFFIFDPMGINFEDNTDEYVPEVKTVLPRLSSATSVDDVVRILHEEFAHWFGSAGQPEHYMPLARETWRIWIEADGRRTT